jgi:hypothetical protein
MSSHHVEVVTAQPIIDALLDRYRVALGDDASSYLNRVYRCINYHQVLLGAPIPDFAALAWVAQAPAIGRSHDGNLSQG